MHFSFVEKFATAVLVAVWLVWGTNMLGNILVSPEAGGAVAPTAAPAARGPIASTSPGAPQDAIALLASASPDAGRTAFRKCQACHTVEKGGPNRVGPNLWGIVGAPKGHVESYAFSSAIKQTPGPWDYKALDAFLRSPKEYAPGTKMTFIGVKDAQERAALIAYLRSLSDNPPPLP